MTFLFFRMIIENVSLKVDVFPRVGPSAVVVDNPGADHEGWHALKADPVVLVVDGLLGPRAVESQVGRVQASAHRQRAPPAGGCRTSAIQCRAA